MTVDPSVIERLKNGEDSCTQFKANVLEARKLAEEMVAFSNAAGGDLFLGVSDSGEVIGLEDADIHRLNQLVSNTANENVKPPIYPFVESVLVEDRKVLIVRVRRGAHRPYSTSSGVYLTKSGADKRKMSPEELKRLFAESGGFFADEEIIPRSDITDLNAEAFYAFLDKKDPDVYVDLKEGRLELATVLQNLDLIRDGRLTLAGNLLFGMNPQRFSKSFYVQCVHFDGTDVDVDRFVSKEAVTGTLHTMYKQSLNFCKSNLRRVQDADNFNTPGKLEIPEQSLMEAIINALVHRDYYINATVKVFIFADKAEVISPGKLPNCLTIDKIKSGISVHRNPVLNSLGQYLLPYSGLGSGIRRMMRHSPGVRFVNDTDKEEFRCIFAR